jgi:hypothetical protein
MIPTILSVVPLTTAQNRRWHTQIQYLAGNKMKIDWNNVRLTALTTAAG